MDVRRYAAIALAIVLGAAATARAQQKLLSIDDIYDPRKRVDFSGLTFNDKYSAAILSTAGDLYSVSEGLLVKHLRVTMFDFIVEHLKPAAHD